VLLQVVVSDQGKYLCYCDDHGEVKVWDLELDQSMKALPRRHGNVYPSLFLKKKKKFPS